MSALSKAAARIMPFAPGIFGVAVSVMMGAGPSQAESNFCGWISLVLDLTPHCWRGFPTAGMWAIVLVLIVTTAVWWAYAQRGRVDSGLFVNAGIFLIVIGLLGVVAGQVLRSREIRRGTTTSPPAVVTVASATPTGARVTKFYSREDKNRLGDALYKLSDLLIAKGESAAKKADDFSRLWDRQVTAPEPNVKLLRAKVNEISALTAELYRGVYDDDGLLAQYRPYTDELEDILNDSRTSTKVRITDLQIAVNRVGVHIEVMERAAGHTDRGLIDAVMRSAVPDLTYFQNNASQFGGWITERIKRIGELRQRLAKQ